VTDPEVLWRGLTLGGDTDIDVHSVTGWDDLDDVDTSLDSPRGRGHGDIPGDLYARARIVTVRGAITNRARRDELAQAILAVTPVTSPVEDLTIDTLGQWLTAGARLVRRSLPVEEDYASGHIPFALAWRCPDPRRYGAERTASTALPDGGGGLSYPLSYPLDYGTPGVTGRITLANPGTADAPILLGITGGLTAGFEVSASGQRLRYPTPVPAGQTIDIDTDTGTVLIEGTADRRGELTVADWLLIPAQSSLTVQFTSLGGARDPNARLTARWKPTYW
jgi:hypothetical protein